MTSAASGRRRSRSTTSAAGTTRDIDALSVGSASMRPSMTTRAPSAARSPALRYATAVLVVGVNISGAPKTHDPRPSNVDALHFREDANGMVAVRVQCVAAGTASTIALSVLFGWGSAGGVAARAAAMVGPA